LKDILLITPPFTQLNTPYPATAYIKGFLNTLNVSSHQMDLGIEVILELFSKKGLHDLFEASKDVIKSPNAQRIFTLREEYIQIIDNIIVFLQGKNPTFARQICTENFLPQASRFDQVADLDWAFGSMGLMDKAKHLATLFLEDLSDFIIECVDPHFGFSRYAERLGKSAHSFDELYSELLSENSYIDEITLKILQQKIENYSPKLVLISVPFPGNLYSAFKCGQWIKKHFPSTKIAMGGGFPNTELRSIKDERIFEFFDYITLDDGELPVELLIHNYVYQQSDEKGQYKRTFLLENEVVVYKNNSQRKDFKQSDVGTPDYSDLQLHKYISVIEVTNPMHSLWSDGRWNKLTMAHGCYWGKCTFCDISLDYIKIYEPIAAKLLVDRVEELILQTGETGFHFVDEAAPPALMKAFALEILKRKITISWWTNIRFEKNFSQDLCYLLAASGCIAVSGGLEVASDRLLELIQKGVTVEQVAQVTRNFTQSGIMVHAYLMYGYPTQTVQETVDSLEMVRQLFDTGVLQSGFWHQFALTAHSPVGMSPEDYGILPEIKDITFAHNDIDFVDKTGIDHNQFSFGLKKSLYNYMHGIGFELPLQSWFDFKIPKTSIKNDYILQCIEKLDDWDTKPSSKVVWLGTIPNLKQFTKSKKGKNISMVTLVFETKVDSFELELEADKGEWLVQMLGFVSCRSSKTYSFKEVKENFESKFEHFELFWYSSEILELRERGLLVL
jgi:hypothetical protein